MPGVCRANSIVTVQLAPHSVIATLSLDFFDYLRAPEIERAVVELEARVRRNSSGSDGIVRQAAERIGGGTALEGQQRHASRPLGDDGAAIRDGVGAADQQSTASRRADRI